MMDVYSEMAKGAMKQQDVIKTRIASESTASEIAGLREDVRKLEVIRTEIETLRKELKDAQQPKWYQNTVLWATVIAAGTGIAAIFISLVKC